MWVFYASFRYEWPFGGTPYLFTCPCWLPLRCMWFWSLLWLTNLHSPLYLPLFLYSSHSDLFVLPLTIWTQGRNWMFCKLLEAHFSLCAGYTPPEFCKCAGGLLTPFALIPKFNRDIIIVLSPIPPTLRFNTGFKAWKLANIPALWVFLQFSSLRWATKSFSDSKLHPNISCFTLELRFQWFNTLILNLLSNFLPHCSFVCLADFIERWDLRIQIKKLDCGWIGPTIHNCEVLSLFLKTKVYHLSEDDKRDVKVVRNNTYKVPST